MKIIQVLKLTLSANEPDIRVGVIIANISWNMENVVSGIVGAILGLGNAPTLLSVMF